MRPHNRPQIPSAVIKALGIKSELNTPVEEVIGLELPVMSALDTTPYLQLGYPVAYGRTGTIAALNYSALLVRPGANLALQVKKIVFGPNQNAALQALNLRTLTLADVATMTLGTVSAMAALAPQPEIGLKSTRPSTMTDARFTATVGNSFMDINLAATGGMFVLDLPDPGIILYADDKNGVPALSIAAAGANEYVTATVFGREWNLAL